MLAAALALRMKRGDGDAAYRLAQRGRALRGIQRLGWKWRLAMATAASQRNHEALLVARALAAERRRLEEECVVPTQALLAALRVRYGSGVVRTDYREGECRPVPPGGKCAVCSWRWGSTVPHIIAVP